MRAGTLACVLAASVSGASGQSLQQALSHAYSNNPEIASAFMGVRAAREAVRREEGARYPTIGGSANVGGSWADTPQVPGASNWASSASVGLSYSQTIFDNFASDSAILAAEAEYDAAVHQARNVEQNVLLSVATAYMHVVRDRRLVEIRQENIGFVRAQLQSARDRLELGEGTRLDVVQAEARLAQADAAYQQALANLRISEANYQRWVGQSPSGLNGSYNFGSLLPGSVSGAMGEAEGRHPALLASQAAIRASQFRAEQTRAGYGPSISLSGSAGVGQLTTTPAGTARVELSLSVPIYSPARSPAIESANISRIRSELDSFATRDQVVEAVRQAWAGLQSSTAQIESATAAVAASRLALQAMVDQQEVGQATTLDVLDSRANLLTVEETLVQAQAQRVIAAFSLIAATGNLSAQVLSLPVQLRSPDGSVAAPAPAPVVRDSWSGLR